MKIKFLQLSVILLLLALSYGCEKNHDPITYKLTTSDISQLIGDAYYECLMPHTYSFVNPNNIAFGSVYGGDARLLPAAGVEGFGWQFDVFQVSSYNADLIQKWKYSYNGISFCNNSIDTLSKAVTNTEVNQALLTTGISELRFLRGFMYFELAKVFGPQLPYYDENTSKDEVPSDITIWNNIEADFLYASENLPESWGTADAGRANKWAARAFLGKVKLYEAKENAGKYAEALLIFEEVMTNGMTSKGEKYGLMTNFDDNFNVTYNNNMESVFAEQSRLDGSGRHGNFGYVLAYPYVHKYPGYFNPTFSLTNSYKVNESGLPFLDGSYNNTDLNNDMGLSSDAAYKADSVVALDPRLDWTVGRRDIPYLNWGLHQGAAWIAEQDYSGCYSPVKNVFRIGDATELQDGWGVGTGLNVPLMRYADLLLMAAECYAQPGSTLNLSRATELVNQIRTRAGNKSVPGSKANYKVGLYSSFASTDDAMKAVKFERKLELAMEGHRYFDLVRWGDSASELEFVCAHEKNSGLSYYNPANIISGYFPRPDAVYLNAAE
jgi:starch-binding outer membrane protein, SusD/RagB family